MGLFDFLKKDGAAAPETSGFPFVLGAPANGMFLLMEQIPDEVFSGGVLGVCCGIDPEEGKVFSPADGKISQVADTGHAVGIETSGIDLLIHVGVDTVEMNGDGFHVNVNAGQKGGFAADHGFAEDSRCRPSRHGNHGSHQHR